MSGAANTLADEAVPKFPRGVRLRHDKVRDAWVLLAPERLITCDAIACAVLRLVDGQNTLSAIIATLAGTYQAEPALIARDVKALLMNLRDKKMVDI